jgi:HlyD family secretion protein
MIAQPSGWQVLLLIAALFVSPACQKQQDDLLQGYVEGEFVYVAAPSAGKLQKLHVSRGQQVKSGDPLFELEDVTESSARDEAARRLAQARANLEDVTKGQRPQEIESLEAQLNQARAALALSEREYERQQELLKTGVASRQEFDRARATRAQDRERTSQLEADMKTARLGAREDQIAAAQANVKALEATLRKAGWDLEQKCQVTGQGGAVFDTLYREGEWVAAGRPVVALLPPENVKVRAFVPEPLVGSVKIGGDARVIVDGRGDPLVGKISYISPRAEFTPPVIYSRETRSKLVFMIEIRFDRAAAAGLHPGQPVDVAINP